MTVDFINHEFQITQTEQYNHEPYIGYIDPNGNLIDFNNPFGESGHDGWVNIVTNAFLQFVSYIIKESDNNSNKNYSGVEESVIRGMGAYLNENYEDFDKFLDNLEFFLKYRPSDDSIREFQYQLFLFFKKAYANRTFFETIGKTIEVTSEKDYYIQANNLTEYDDPERKYYINNLEQELMQYFKDIVVSYLGYDSIERFQPNGQLLKIPSDTRDFHSFYKPHSSYFYHTPRIITTSSSNINERFFNHLIMDWSIHKIPKYNWNEQSLKFELEPDYREYYANEKEEILGKEIQAIKRLVPLKNRHKYFR